MGVGALWRYRVVWGKKPASTKHYLPATFGLTLGRGNLKGTYGVVPFDLTAVFVGLLSGAVSL